LVHLQMDFPGWEIRIDIYSHDICRFSSHLDSEWGSQHV
jgi:hypothetical protein